MDFDTASLQVVPLSRDHAPDLVEIEQSGPHPSWTLAHFLAEFESGHSATFGILVQTALVGFVVLHQILDEMHVLNVVVHRDFRRRGLGTLLIEKVVERAVERGVRTITLEVRRSNSAGRALYTGYGFVHIGTRKGYYADNGEDALILGKRVCR